MNAAKSRAAELAADENAQLARMREHNAGFVTVAEPPKNDRDTITAPVAGYLAGLPQQIKAQVKSAREFTEEIDDIFRRSKS